MNSGRSILIVEDNADIRDLLTRMLQAEGFTVITAEDCASGFDELLKQEPALVIADVMLPDYSGLQFIRWVRERTTWDSLPVIAITAFEPGYLLAATHLGADAIIHKPEGLDSLSETVNQVLSQKSPSANPLQRKA
jgi:DNA-binding response OmpR family regulator